MKSAYLYLRVSTDEQKRKGYSLPEQEDRLLKYCENNSIIVRGIYREDFSAKNFNRPEWKKLILEIKKNKDREENNILFVKWDRFSRNIQYAYETIGLLRKYNTTAIAIDQPVDLNIPESSVMLAVYLSIPEAENTRRALNTSNGMRRAKLMGRYPCRAPIGFVNLTSVEGKKFISPKRPEADIVRWVFLQLAKNIYRVAEVRRMAMNQGLKCSCSYFSKLIRNPVYCGLISIVHRSGELEFVKGNHEELISQSVFYEVQDILNSKRKVSSKNNELKAMFFLTGFMDCPLCGKKICGSFSQGSRNKYPYYHCRNRCSTRINARLINLNYEQKLKQFTLSEGASDLFSQILDDVNLDWSSTEYFNERQGLLRRLLRQQTALSNARRLFVDDILKLDDYNEFKREMLDSSNCLMKEIDENMEKINSINLQREIQRKSCVDIFGGFSSFDVADKRHLAKVIPPKSIDFKTGNLLLMLQDALSKILVPNQKMLRL
jgi:site-specific DNA recombinase